jgi:hypothetical protein
MSRTGRCRPGEDTSVQPGIETGAAPTIGDGGRRHAEQRWPATRRSGGQGPEQGRAGAEAGAVGATTRNDGGRSR